MNINTNFDQEATNRYRDHHADMDPDHTVEHLIENGNFDDNVSYSKTNEIFEVMKNVDLEDPRNSGKTFIFHHSNEPRGY